MSELITPNVIEHNIIKTGRNIRPVTVKRLATLDGLGTARGLKIGQGVAVDMDTLVYCEITNKDGRKHKKMMLQQVDIHGNYKGLIFAEFFFNADSRA
jgi:hypothetical protein